MNDRVTRKERGLIKGALRRVFSRSELRQRAIALSRIEHVDLKRPRVTKWSRCPICLEPTPTYLMDADHVDPVVPLDRAAYEMTADELVDRMWCEQFKIQAVCRPCHKQKSKAENKERRRLKR